MPYLGRGLEKGNYLKLDDISSQFDGSKTTFNLTVGGSAHVPGSSYSLLVSLSGIVQEGEAAYTLDQNEITFAAAPQAADDCFIISLGTPLGIGVPSNGTVNGTQLAKPLNYDNFFHLDHTNDRVGIGTSLPTQSLDVYDGNIAIRDPATASQSLGFYHNRNVLKASIDKTGNNLTFENVDSGIIDYKIGGSSRVSIGSTGKIFFASDDNTYFYRPGADTLGFLTGGTERLRIDSNGRVRIANTDLTASSKADNLIVGTTSGQNGITIFSGTSNTGNIYFGDTDTAGVENRMGTITYDHSGNFMRFSTSGNQEKVRILSTGEVGIGTTNPQNSAHVQHFQSLVRHQSFQSNQGDLAIVSDNNSNPVVYVKGTGNANLVRVLHNTNERLRIASAGQLGIGGANYGTAGQVLTSGGSSAAPSWSGGSTRVLEYFNVPCSGESVVTSHGTRTTTNVTGVQNLTTSYVTLSGSQITYRPPTGTHTVVYKFSFQATRADADTIGHFKFYVGSDEIQYARHTIRGEDFQSRVVFEWPIRIDSGSATNTNHARLQSWNSDLVLKMEGRDYSGTYDMKIHITDNWDGAGTDMFSMPTISVTALGT